MVLLLLIIIPGTDAGSNKKKMGNSRIWGIHKAIRMGLSKDISHSIRWELPGAGFMPKSITYFRWTIRDFLIKVQCHRSFKLIDKHSCSREVWSWWEQRVTEEGLADAHWPPTGKWHWSMEQRWAHRMVAMYVARTHIRSCLAPPDTACLCYLTLSSWEKQLCEGACDYHQVHAEKPKECRSQATGSIPSLINARGQFKPRQAIFKCLILNHWSALWLDGSCTFSPGAQAHWAQ